MRHPRHCTRETFHLHNLHLNVHPHVPPCISLHLRVAPCISLHLVALLWAGEAVDPAVAADVRRDRPLHHAARLGHTAVCAAGMAPAGDGPAGGRERENGRPGVHHVHDEYNVDDDSGR